MVTIGRNFLGNLNELQPYMPVFTLRTRLIFIGSVLLQIRKVLRIRSRSYLQEAKKINKKWEDELVKEEKKEAIGRTDMNVNKLVMKTYQRRNKALIRIRVRTSRYY